MASIFSSEVSHHHPLSLLFSSSSFLASSSLLQLLRRLEHMRYYGIISLSCLRTPTAQLSTAPRLLFSFLSPIPAAVFFIIPNKTPNNPESERRGRKKSEKLRLHKNRILKNCSGIYPCVFISVFNLCQANRLQDRQSTARLM